MKRIWVALGIVVFIITLYICEYSITFSAVDEINNFLKDVNNGVSINILKEESTELIQKWDDKKPLLDIFLNHDEVDSISQSIAVINAYAESQTKVLLYAECKKLEEMASSLTDPEQFLIENIL